MMLIMLRFIDIQLAAAGILLLSCINDILTFTPFYLSMRFSSFVLIALVMAVTLYLFLCNLFCSNFMSF